MDAAQPLGTVHLLCGFATASDGVDPFYNAREFHPEWADDVQAEMLAEQLFATLSTGVSAAVDAASATLDASAPYA